MVVLGFYLQEGDAAVHIGAYADFLTGTAAVVVLHVVVEVIGVPVCSAVGGDAASCIELGVVLALGQPEEFHQFCLVRDEFLVRTVHQTDAGHLLKRDGLKLKQKVTYLLVKVRFIHG